MFPDHKCYKKDKRLLVLLVFGAILIFSDLKFFSAHEPFHTDLSWLEIQGTGKLYRLAIESLDEKTFENVKSEKIPYHLQQSLIRSLKQEKSASVAGQEGRAGLLSGVSPRLAYILGLPVPINAADAEDLVFIPGIGPVLAGKIEDYVKNKGPVTEARQLENIQGIGHRMRLRLQDHFTYAVNNE